LNHKEEKEPVISVRVMMQIEIAGRLRRAGGQEQLKYMTHVRPMFSSQQYIICLT
jgi:hypothetical protein